jgi:hypothetical protein
MKSILTAAVLAAVVSIVAIPSSVQAKTKVHHRHHGLVRRDVVKVGNCAVADPFLEEIAGLRSLASRRCFNSP